MIANCNFLYAHGFTYITGFYNIGQSSGMVYGLRSLFPLESAPRHYRWRRWLPGGLSKPDAGIAWQLVNTTLQTKEGRALALPSFAICGPEGTAGWGGLKSPAG